MKKSYISILVSIVVLLQVPIQAQPNEFSLTKDLEFFYEQKDQYQEWLIYRGFSPILSVEDIEVTKDRLSLYLKFPYQNLDSIVSAWDTLKYTFEQTNSISLEQKLFYKLAHLMEVRQSQINVQIYDTYDLRKEPLFFRGIYFDTESGRIKVSTSDPKSEIRKIVLRPKAIGGKRPSVENFQKSLSKELVFQTILTYAKNKYNRSPCDGRKPQVSTLETGEVLRFEVHDLCREVLIDEANPILCEYVLRPLGYKCDWAKREMLDFIITYDALIDGIKLTIEVDGKFGAGFYNQIERGGYIAMDKEPRLYKYLILYADKLREALRAELQRL